MLMLLIAAELAIFSAAHYAVTVCCLNVNCGCVLPSAGNRSLGKHLTGLCSW
jgi:hypothetical protein